MATIKITGVDDDTARFVADRARALHFKGQAEYLRNLVREDMARAAAERRAQLVNVLEPLHAHAEKEGFSDVEILAVFEKARDEVAAQRAMKKSLRER